MFSKTRIFGLACASLLLIALVLQFVPYWNFTTETGEASCSIAGYVWLPYKHDDMSAYLQTAISPDYTINQVWPVPVLMMVFGLLGIAFALFKPELPIAAVCSCIAGGCGIWGFLSNAALKLGSLWVVHLLLSIVLLAAGAAAIAVFVRER